MEWYMGKPDLAPGSASAFLTFLPVMIADAREPAGGAIPATVVLRAMRLLGAASAPAPEAAPAAGADMPSRLWR